MILLGSLYLPNVLAIRPIVERCHRDQRETQSPIAHMCLKVNQTSYKSGFHQGNIFKLLWKNHLGQYGAHEDKWLSHNV